MDHPIPHDWVIDNKVLTIPTYEPPKDQPVVIGNVNDAVERRLMELFKEVQTVKTELAHIKRDLHMDVLLAKIAVQKTRLNHYKLENNIKINDLHREINRLRHDINWFTKRLNENIIDFIQHHDQDHEQLIRGLTEQLEFIHQLIGGVDNNTLAIDEGLKYVTDRVYLIEHKNHVLLNVNEGSSGDYFRQALPNVRPVLVLGPHIASIPEMPVIAPPPEPGIPPPPDPPGIPPPPPPPPRIVRRPP
jgi:hypothetical protein